MNGRLLTRRALPTLVAALSLGVAGQANAATQVSVASDGTLKITSGDEANGISLYRISDEIINGTRQQVVVVRDGDTTTLPAPGALPVPLPTGSPLNPGPGCVSESDKRGDPDPLPTQTTQTVRCTSSPAGSPDVTGQPTKDGAFTKVDAMLNGGDDIFAVYQGAADGKGRSVLTLSIPMLADGGAAGDVLYGGVGNDTLTGGAGDDDLRGFAGNDVLKPNGGVNQVIGGPDTDTVDYGDQTDGLAISLDDQPNDGAGCNLDPIAPNDASCQGGNVASDVENVTTGSGPDLVSGSGADNVITTGVGNDTVYGGGGTDTIALGEGNNTVYGDDGPYQAPKRAATIVTLPAKSGPAARDIITAGAGDDLIYGGDEADVAGAPVQGDDITAGNGTNTVFGGSGSDKITAGIGDDTVRGGSGDDNVTAGDGANKLFGETGNDTIASGTGNDTVDAGDGDDKVGAGTGNNDVKLGAGNDGPLTTGGDVTGTGNDTVDGGAGNDVIKDAGGNNQVQGGDNSQGQDQITTGAGNDVIYGGVKGQDSPADGADAINSGAGDDTVVGGRGGDFMDAGDGSDIISYEEKTEPVYAVVVTSNTPGSGTYCDPYPSDAERATWPTGATCEGDTVKNAESLFGGSANDVLAGDDLTGSASQRKCVSPAKNSFNTALKGGAGDDQLFGCAGNDVLFGDAGRDNLVGGDGSDEIHGGDGQEDCGAPGQPACPAWSPIGGDAVSYQDSSAGVTVTLGDGLANDGKAGENDNLFGDIENVTGSDYDDSLTGSGQRNRLDGLGRSDKLDGGFGPDVLIGGAGRDLVTYESRNTAIRATLDGTADDGQANEGDDIDQSVEDVTGGSGDDVFVGQPTSTANGGFVDNRFTGNGGNDAFDGGPGADEFLGGDGLDTTIYDRPATETVTARINGLPESGSVTDQAEGLRDTIFKDVENLTGGEERDVFTGDQDPNVLSGNDGADELSGLQGDDRLSGGAGDDTVNGGAGLDSLQGGLGNDVIIGEGGTDTVDYTDRTNANRNIRVTYDNVADDGDQSLTPPETDNVKADVETCNGCTGTAPSQPAPSQPASSQPASSQPASSQPAPSQSAAPTTASSTSGSSGDESKVAGSSGEQTTTVSPTTTQKQPTAMEVLASPASTRSNARKLLVSGRILVKARSGLAQSSAAMCKRGGKVRVVVRKGKRIVGRRVVRLGSTCTFRAPVKLTRQARGTVRVQVKFLGNEALKPTKRTTKLQVNG